MFLEFYPLFVRQSLISLVVEGNETSLVACGPLYFGGNVVVVVVGAID